jgi:hypothetical protein
MAYDLAPLRSYVRFYQTVVTQLDSAWAALIRTHQTAQERLQPFGEPLGVLQSSALQAALGPAPAPPAALRELWQPQDPKDLTGLTDVYEVVGRFSFQGVDDENLKRVQALVSSARNEVHVQRGRLAELARLPDAASAQADRMASEESRGEAQKRANRLAAFAPLAQTLQQRAAQTINAVRAVPIPELRDVNAAANEYKTFAKKLDQVYQTCLPFLRKALQDMLDYAGCQISQSWPESLPIQPELPPEFLMVPPADSPETRRAKAAVESLQEEDIQLARARDDVAVTVTRLEAELGQYVAKDAEAAQEIERAGVLVSYAKSLEELDQTRRNIAQLEQQKAQRTQAIGELLQRHKETEAAIAALEQELATRKHEISEASQQLAVERDNEPAIFGKDEWRRRVADLENLIDQLRNAYAQREGVLNQLRIDLSSLGVQAQTEGSQRTLIDRWIADAAAKEKKLVEESRALESKLGSGRPLHTPSVGDAEQVMAATQAMRAEIQERIERLKAQIRSNKEESARIVARLKQIEVERQKMSGYLQSAVDAASRGQAFALEQMAVRRRSAVEQHVNEVLGELEKSLNAVEAVFIEPAREAMLQNEQPSESRAAVIREQAALLRPVAQALASELEQELLAQDALLGQLQREFCDVAPEACRNAWG